MNSIRPLAVVLRLLAADSPARPPAHPLHPFHVPASRTPVPLRSPPPFTVNRFARVGVPLGLDYWPVLGEEVEQAMYWHSVPRTPEPWHGAPDTVTPNPAPHWPAIRAACALLDPSRPWEVQDTLTDPHLYGLDEAQCVIWIASLGGSRGKSIPLQPSRLPYGDRHMVALVINNSAEHSGHLIDVLASVARSGGTPTDALKVRAVVDRLNAWLGVLFAAAPDASVPDTPSTRPPGAGRPPSAALVESRKQTQQLKDRLTLVSGRIQAAALEMDAVNLDAAAFLRGLLDPATPDDVPSTSSHTHQGDRP